MEGALAAVAAAADVGQPHVLREYALLADGERGILVGPRGDFAWMCFPSWESPAVFASLIGGGGTYSVTPMGRYVWGGYYEDGSLIWHSRWVTETGIVECREALALPSRRDRAVVLRRVIGVSGSARVGVILDARADYGRAKPAGVRREGDRWSMHVGGAQLCWYGAGDAAAQPTAAGTRLAMDIRVSAGEQRDLVLVLDRRDAGEEVPGASEAWESTEREWARRIPRLRSTAAPRDARHACAVMLGLTGSGGGMVAAATASLPERADAGRSYDYRYVWIRDQCYAGQAAAQANVPELLDGATGFVQQRLLADGPRMMPAYTAGGGRVPDQSRLDLPGYPGGTDITGNHVNQQFQLDIFGEALLLFASAARADRLDADGWAAAQLAVDAIAQRWHEPDAGIWELEPRRWTHSRLICVAGLRAMGEIVGADRASPAAWQSLAGTILDEVARHAVHSSGRWQRADDDPRLDAALLLPGLRGAVPASDRRTLATLHAVEEELTSDGYCYRFKTDDVPLGEAEGAFLLCGFLLSLAFAQQGENVKAARWFERNRASCGPPGLLSEEFDVRQRQLRGNLPQAFVHALLLECAARAVHTA